MEPNLENLIRSMAINAADRNRDFADVQIRVRQNGSGSVQFGSAPAREFQGPNTFAEIIREYTSENAT